MIVVGCDRETSIGARQLAAGHDEVEATVGLHPHEARHGVDTIVDLIDDDTVAIGECGLDYHYDHSPRDVQREAFAAQIALANERALPLVIHTREAWDDTFDVLVDVGVPERVVFHCFTGGVDEAAPGARPRRLPQLLRDRHVQECRRRPRRRHAVPGGPVADRDGQPVPGARSAPRPAQPAGLVAARRDSARRASRGSGGAPVCDDERGNAPGVRARRLRSRASGRRTPAPTDMNRSNL